MMMAGSAALASQVQGLAVGAHLAANPGAERTRLRCSFAGAALRPGGGRSAAAVWSGAGAGAGAAYASPRAVMERLAPSQPNFYELLGLPQDVALPDIKLAYRQMAKKFHPDVCPPGQSKECAEKFIEMQEAYETLSDPRRRASYDRDMANSLSAIAYGRRRCADAPSAAEWKSQWEDQLSTLKRRAAVRNAAAPESWGPECGASGSSKGSTSRCSSSRTLRGSVRDGGREPYYCFCFCFRCFTFAIRGSRLGARGSGSRQIWLVTSGGATV